MDTKERTSYEVNTSSDGKSWFRFRTDGRFEGTSKGHRQAIAAAKTELKHSRHTRVVHVTKRITDEFSNERILSPDQIKELIARGQQALAGIPGVTVTEGCEMGFGATDIVMSPTRVSVNFHAAAILGKRPVLKAKGLLTADYEALKELRVKWDMEAKALEEATSNQCSAKLKVAGVWHTHEGHRIVLRPNGG